MSFSSKNICASYYGEETTRSLTQFNIGLPTGKKLFFTINLLKSFYRSNSTTGNQSTCFLEKSICNRQ